MVNLTINGRAVSVPEGTTIMEAAKQCSVHIPNLCYLENVHKFGSCRVCLVEVQGAKTLQASCMATVSEGMVVHTNSKKVRDTRHVMYELLLSDHEQNCLSCKRNQNCELQELGRRLGVEETRFKGEHSEARLETAVSITRDMSKCVLCRRCVSVCNQIQGVGILNAQNRGFQTTIGPAMELPINTVNCAFCGQCTVVCPVGALRETDAVEKVWDILSDKTKRRVVQVAPAVRVAIGEEFGLEPGSQVTGKLAASLKALGFDDIFDTNFAADLTILEEGTEFLHRVKDALTGGPAVLPMITSCSPGWIKYVEHTYPHELDHLSTCKSPHMMLGALAKSYYAGKLGVAPQDVKVVSVMPCTAKKYEISRAELQNNGQPNVDAVLTTRELAQMIHETGIDFKLIEDRPFDNPLGMSTGAADIFGVTGGVMEAALRTVYELVTGRELPFDGLHVQPIVGLDQVKTADILIENPLPAYQFLDGVTVKVAVTSGLSGANKLMEDVAAGTSPYHFIEVMGCPGGCITGGGQPRSADPDVRAKRMRGLYSEDEGKVLRKSHDNPAVQSLYGEFLEHPNSHVSHSLLHTHYVMRGLRNEYVSNDRQPQGGKPMPKRASEAEKGHRSTPENAARRTHEDLESVKVLALEAENARLKQELADAMETEEILKRVIQDFVKKND